MLLKLAWRNIWRNKRRSFLTLGAVVFATLMAIAMRGIQKGTYALNIKTVVELFSGYLQIQKKGYHDNPSLNSSFRYNAELKTQLNSVKEVTGYTPRVYADGLISLKDVSLGTAIIGINPKTEKDVATFYKNVNEGEFLKSDSSNNILVGYKMLKNLDAKIGDEVVLLSQGFDGSLGNQKFKIVGTMKMGVSEMDANAILVGIKTLQYMLGMGNRVNVLAIKTNNLEQANEAQQIIDSKINNNDLTVLSWDEFNPELKQTIQLDNVSGILFLGILIVIVAFGILNTVLMSVTERFREFGVVLAIGMPQKKLVYLVFIETILITAVGMLIGDVLGFIVNSYIVANPISLGEGYKALLQEYHFVPQLESSIHFAIFANVSISIIVISLLSCLYPVYKVFKLEPLKGIRYT